jgi:hypothetical protein
LGEFLEPHVLHILKNSLCRCASCFFITSVIGIGRHQTSLWSAIYYCRRARRNPRESGEFAIVSKSARELPAEILQVRNSELEDPFLRQIDSLDSGKGLVASKLLGKKMK